MICINCMQTFTMYRPGERLRRYVGQNWLLFRFLVGSNGLATKEDYKLLVSKSTTGRRRQAKSDPTQLRIPYSTTVDLLGSTPRSIQHSIIGACDASKLSGPCSRFVLRLLRCNIGLGCTRFHACRELPTATTLHCFNCYQRSANSCMKKLHYFCAVAFRAVYKHSETEFALEY